jgi:hypothetical protein
MDNYYFVSSTNFDNEILHPRIPENRMKNENSIKERICVSKSINGCLSALGKLEFDEILYVHTCQADSRNVMQPSIQDVEDSPLTGEEWIITSTQMKLFMKIKINGVIYSIINNMHNTVFAFEVIRD